MIVSSDVKSALYIPFVLSKVVGLKPNCQFSQLFLWFSSFIYVLYSFSIWHWFRYLLQAAVELISCMLMILTNNDIQDCMFAWIGSQQVNSVQSGSRSRNTRLDVIFPSTRYIDCFGTTFSWHTLSLFCCIFYCCKIILFMINRCLLEELLRIRFGGDLT